jgi:hypothetical protein
VCAEGTERAGGGVDLGGGGGVMVWWIRWYAGARSAVVSAFCCQFAHSPPFCLSLLHCVSRVPPAHTGSSRLLLSSTLDGPPSSSSSSSRSASAAAAAATTAATSTLQVKSPYLATLTCLAPAGSDFCVHSSSSATFDIRRSVTVCDSYEMSEGAQEALG